MRMGWFEHSNCTAEEADELLRQYRKRGMKAERSLSADCKTFVVRVLLPESKYPPRQDTTFQQRMWR